MASISNDPGGRRRILFTAPCGARKTLRLGKVDRKTAESICRHVEALLGAKLAGQPIPRETAAWLGSIGDVLRDKLALAGLIEAPAAADAMTLGTFLAEYIARRTDVKPRTLDRWRHAMRNLVTFFGADRPIATISPGDACDFERWLATAREHRYVDKVSGDSLAANTVRKRLQFAKQFFEDAVARHLIATNPFAGRKSSTRPNRTRDHFVTPEDTDAIIDACPDAEWRLIVALARYGGLRCPGEHLALKWSDVNWERARLTIRSPKTEHHEGKDCRVIPLFPELRPLLEAAWDAAPEGAEFVIGRYRDTNANLRTQLLRIIRRAGVKPWPKLFMNMRASRATELVAEHPAHVAAEWMGHSRLVAQKHYWQVTDADFERGAKSGALGAQNAAQQGDAENCTRSNESLQVVGVLVSNQSLATCDDLLQNSSTPRRGLEPLT